MLAPFILFLIGWPKKIVFMCQDRDSWFICIFEMLCVCCFLKVLMVLPRGKKPRWRNRKRRQRNQIIRKIIKIDKKGVVKSALKEIGKDVSKEQEIIVALLIYLTKSIYNIYLNLNAMLARNRNKKNKMAVANPILVYFFNKKLGSHPLSKK